jgi:transglutaminase-like putative cysteine protease
MTKPPPGRPRVIGADVSHAWLSIFVPEFGWLDLDPTNGIVPSDSHITVGWARDYDDMSPVKGVITGGRRHSLSVSVHVEPIDLAATAPSSSAIPVDAASPATSRE